MARTFVPTLIIASLILSIGLPVWSNGLAKTPGDHYVITDTPDLAKSVVFHPEKDKIRIGDLVYHPGIDSIRLIDPVYHPNLNELRIYNLGKFIIK